MEVRDKRGVSQKDQAVAYKLRQALILQMIHGETTVAKAAHKYYLAVCEVIGVAKEGSAAMERSLRSRLWDEPMQYWKSRTENKADERFLDSDDPFR